MKKNGVFLFVISHLVPEILKIFVLCVTLWKSKHKIENSSASNHAMKLKLGEHVIA